MELSGQKLSQLTLFTYGVRVRIYSYTTIYCLDFFSTPGNKAGAEESVTRVVKGWVALQGLQAHSWPGNARATGIVARVLQGKNAACKMPVVAQGRARHTAQVIQFANIHEGLFYLSKWVS